MLIGIRGLIIMSLYLDTHCHVHSIYLLSWTLLPCAYNVQILLLNLKSRLWCVCVCVHSQISRWYTIRHDGRFHYLQLAIPSHPIPFTPRTILAQIFFLLPHSFTSWWFPNIYNISRHCQGVHLFNHTITQSEAHWPFIIFASSLPYTGN